MNFNNHYRAPLTLFCRKTPKHGGFGLVELMLGLLLGTCLLSLMLRHYLTIKQHSLDTAKVLAQAYDRQFITELVTTSIAQAGFTPCGPIRWLTGRDSSKTESLEAVRLNVGNKKALQISRMSEDFSVIVDTLSTHELLVEADAGLKSQEQVLVADCFHAEINTIQSIKREGLVLRVSLKNPLHYVYTAPVYIGEWLQERFFVEKNKKGATALYYQVIHPEELSDQIKDFSAQLARLGDKQLVSIDFVLEQGKTWHMETAVRV